MYNDEYFYQHFIITSLKMCERKELIRKCDNENSQIKTNEKC